MYPSSAMVLCFLARERESGSADQCLRTYARHGPPPPLRCGAWCTCARRLPRAPEPRGGTDALGRLLLKVSRPASRAASIFLRRVSATTHPAPAVAMACWWVLLLAATTRRRSLPCPTSIAAMSVFVIGAMASSKARARGVAKASPGISEKKLRREAVAQTLL